MLGEEGRGRKEIFVFKSVFKFQAYKYALKLRRCKKNKWQFVLYFVSTVANTKDTTHEEEKHSTSPQNTAPALPLNPSWARNQSRVEAEIKHKLTRVFSVSPATLPSQLKQWLPWKSINLAAQPGCSSVLRLWRLLPWRRLWFQCPAHVQWDRKPARNIPTVLRTWVVLFGAAWGCPWPFLLCQGCSYLSKQSCVGSLSTPAKTIPTQNPELLWAVPAAPFLHRGVTAWTTS